MTNRRFGSQVCIVVNDNNSLWSKNCKEPNPQEFLDFDEIKIKKKYKFKEIIEIEDDNPAEDDVIFLEAKETKSKKTELAKEQRYLDRNNRLCSSHKVLSNDLRLPPQPKNDKFIQNTENKRNSCLQYSPDTSSSWFDKGNSGFKSKYINLRAVHEIVESKPSSRFKMSQQEEQDKTIQDYESCNEKSLILIEKPHNIRIARKTVATKISSPTWQLENRALHQTKGWKSNSFPSKNTKFGQKMEGRDAGGSPIISPDIQLFHEKDREDLHNFISKELEDISSQESVIEVEATVKQRREKYTRRYKGRPDILLKLHEHFDIMDKSSFTPQDYPINFEKLF